ELARGLALLAARVALTGGRRRGLRRPGDGILERPPDTARVLARLVARAAVGLLDAERRGLARRPRQGPRRVARARPRGGGPGGGARRGRAVGVRGVRA